MSVGDNCIKEGEAFEGEAKQMICPWKSMNEEEWSSENDTADVVVRSEGNVFRDKYYGVNLK